MTYKGYTGVARFDDEAGIFCGRVLGLRDVVTFQGTTVEELRQSFRDSVDFYLECCAADGTAPETQLTTAKSPVESPRRPPAAPP
jgi:predicted HicB family RNase H-like nuclease